MSELPNRDELEARFAKRFGLVARRHMHEFRDLLGDPPDLDSVPESFWKKMQDETERETFAILLLIWSDSAEYHGWTGHDMSIAAMGWAATRAEDLGKYWVDSTKDRLEKGFQKLRNPQGRQTGTDETTVDNARETNSKLPSSLQPSRQRPSGGTTEESGRLNPYEPSEHPNIDRDDLRDLLDKTFGPKRVAKVAVNETTAARGSGGEAAIHANGNESDDDLWINPDDSRTCEICHPLVFKKRPEWSRVAPDGPPPPESECWCRCWIKYANAPSVKKSLRDSFSSAWHRTIPNAAEWRAHCFENGLDHTDRSEFKSRWVTLKPHRKEETDYVHVMIDDDGKITTGPRSMLGKKPSELSTHSESPKTKFPAPPSPDTRTSPYKVNLRNVDQATMDSAAKALFGAKYSSDDIPRLCGAPHGSTVYLHSDGHSQISVEMELRGIFHAERKFTRNDDGTVTCSNESITVDKSKRGSGVGGEIIAKQIKELSDAGVSKIVTYAAKGHDTIGYKVWPKLGYDFKFDNSQRLKIKFSKSLPEDARSARTIQELYQFPDGVKWWEKNGEGAVMSINLADKNSISSQKAAAYAAKTLAKSANKSLGPASAGADNPFSESQMRILDDITSEFQKKH